jgi:3-methyladenine DNA glycosylase/8-oxoguanine DNA glycosylase
MTTDRVRSTRAKKGIQTLPLRSVARHRWAAAVQHLRRVDPHLRAIIDRVGPCRLVPHPDRFGALVRSIISQQISSKAARRLASGWWRWEASPINRRA